MNTKLSLIQAYGLDALLTDQDDPALWEAALRQHWPAPGDPTCMVDALRFDLGRRLAEGELPLGEKNELHSVMRGMVDIEEWCFERADDVRLRVKTCPPQTGNPAVLNLGLGLSAMMTIGQGPVIPPIQVVFVYLGISRPSSGNRQAVVFAGTQAPGVGDGSAYLWQKNDQGHWEQTDQCLARWLT